jgi:indole-3-glycerol phosphate synthase
MILDTIVAHKKQEVNTLRARGMREPQNPVDPPRGFFKAVTSHDDVAIIAEAKKASPSKGVIREDFDPQKIALQYKEGGASAISVLTDERFFQGSLNYISLVRQSVDLPVLRKDFIIHELQIEEALKYGADAILLIAAILDTGQLRDYQNMASELGMDVLVEVHNEQELEQALAAESKLIGINNRNLQDFTVSLDTTFRLRKLIPENIPVVSESGIRDQKDMKLLRQGKIAAALIGEAFMRANDPGAALRQLLEP